MTQNIQLFIIYAIIIVLVILLYYMRRPSVKGKIAESRISLSLPTDDNHIVLRNLYVPKNQGGTTEIDLVYITPKGVFVIESKNYAGYIFGNDSNKNWTVTLYAGKKWNGRNKVQKIQFYNPVWQNNTHIKCLKEVLNREIPYYSLVVFSERGELKNINVTSKDTFVLYQKNLNKTLKKICSDVPDTLTADDISDINSILSSLTNADKTTKEDHIKSITETFSSATTCPLCGGTLVLRTAKKGANVGKQFYGCENYPRCKYIQNEI